jgi:membrane-bound ClpP family serine protease
MTVTAGLGCSLALWIWLNRYLPKLPYFNKLILKPATGEASIAFDAPVESGPAIGDIGVAVSELKPGGSVKFITENYPDGRIAAVISESGYIVPGTTVVVREVAGNRVVVRKQA